MKAVIIDTETTGLVTNHSIAIEKQPEVIEFFATHVDLAKGTYGKKLDTLIRPHNWPMTPHIIEITKTKITNEILKNAPPFKQVAADIKKIIASAPVVIAHNAAFDMEMLSLEYEKLGQPMDWFPPLICTVEQTIHMKGHRLSLTNLFIELFGKEFPEAHRAKHDVMALAKCCFKLYKMKLL